VVESVISPNLESLHAVHKECKKTLAALERAKVHNANSEKRWRILTVSGGCIWQDAEEFYERRKAELQEKLLEKIPPTVGNGHAFVTFAKLGDAERAIAFFAGQKGNASFGQRFAELCCGQWQVVPAPNPRDLVHAHLAYGILSRFSRMFGINVLLALVMIFFTTPISLIAVLSQITQANILAIVSTKLAEVFSFFGDADTVYGFVSSTLMLIFTFFIPRVLMLFSRLEKHHTKSGFEMSTVRKIYCYLFLCIILMPAIFMTSVDALLKIALSEDGGWEILRDLGGIFPRAIFFVNYLLAIGLVSNFLELLNFPGALIAWARRRRALTPYERRKGAAR
jgi:hypothetical protein